MVKEPDQKSKRTFDEDGDFLLLVVNSAISSAAQLGMPNTNQNHQVIFSNHVNFTTNVNFTHVRIPVNLTTILNTPKLALKKIKKVNKEVYKAAMEELTSKNVFHNAGK